MYVYADCEALKMLKVKDVKRHFPIFSHYKENIRQFAIVFLYQSAREFDSNDFFCKETWHRATF